MTYPLGWSIIPQMLIRRERWPGGYKTSATALVYPGQEVQADQPVIRLENSESTKADTGPARSTRPGPPFASQRTGDPVTQKELRLNTRQMERIILAGMSGIVIDVTRRGGVIIETRAAIIQGMIGVGSQVAGTLTFWNSSFGYQPCNTFSGEIPPLQVTTPAILVVPGPLNFAMLSQAMNSGVTGIVASSISSRDLEGFLGADLIALINSIDVERAYENLPPLSLLLTEGLGTVAMPSRTVNMLSRYQGSMALLSGVTSIRQSIYPELIISLPVQEIQRNWRPVQTDPTLIVGSLVRICSGSYEGAIGEIIYLYLYQQTFASGVRSRAARVRLENGSTLTMPLFLLERIG